MNQIRIYIYRDIKIENYYVENKNKYDGIFFYNLFFFDVIKIK